MLTLTMRPYQGEADLQPLVELLNTCKVADQIDSTTSINDLRLSFHAPGVNPNRDVRFWEDADGKLIGYSSFGQPESEGANDAYLSLSVHPTARNQGLEADMLTWGEARMMAASRSPSPPPLLRTSTRSTNSNRMAFLEQNGYQVDRHFFSMGRSLHEPIPTPCFSTGFTWRPLAGAAEVPAWVDMFNQSFIDHWNYHPLTVERILHWMRSPDYRPDWDWVAVAPNGHSPLFATARLTQKTTAAAIAGKGGLICWVPGEDFVARA
ncbi:MAG: GNAT family N-acetyltransferase [Cyanothece sp. SIO1E1]|nr:GNAT family N-acetyltransferase [Cyanothece sp. SIO1E1]